MISNRFSVDWCLHVNEIHKQHYFRKRSLNIFLPGQYIGNSSLWFFYEYHLYSVFFLSFPAFPTPQPSSFIINCFHSTTRQFFLYPMPSYKLSYFDGRGRGEVYPCPDYEKWTLLGRSATPLSLRHSL